METTNLSLDFGILYIATGTKYIQEAIASAKSVRQVMSDIPLAIYLDDPDQLPKKLFDFVYQINNPQFSYIDKVVLLQKTPFKQTLFLDTDTLVIDRIDELKTLLSKFDLACTHAPVRSSHNMSMCPDAFAELNTGVILYRQSDAVNHLFQSWTRIYQEQLESDRPPLHDQPAFRQAIFESDINLYILPPEYNLRTVMPMFIGGNAKVKILHGRQPSLNNIWQQLKQAPVAPIPRVSTLQKS